MRGGFRPDFAGLGKRVQQAVRQAQSPELFFVICMFFPFFWICLLDYAIALFLAMLEATDPEGKIIGRIIDRSDSGEVTGDYSHVVDYVGILYESRS